MNEINDESYHKDRQSADKNNDYPTAVKQLIQITNVLHVVLCDIL